MVVAWLFVVLLEEILDVGGRQARYSPSCRGLVSVVSDEVVNSAEADDVLADMLGETKSVQAFRSVVHYEVPVNNSFPIDQNHLLTARVGRIVTTERKIHMTLTDGYK